MISSRPSSLIAAAVAAGAAARLHWLRLPDLGGGASVRVVVAVDDGGVGDDRGAVGGGAELCPRDGHVTVRVIQRHVNVGHGDGGGATA